ncbi:hypothetical protein CRUP_031446, partial [Coryphaenoides rupestris]
RNCEAQGRVHEVERRTTVVPEDTKICDSDKRGSQLFLRSISVGTKPQLKPVLGMNGAKARSQSFSTNYMEKPSVNAQEGPGKIRTHIITNSGERGSSLSRQSSLEVPSSGVPQSPLRSPGMRVSYYGGMTEVPAHSIVSPQTSKPGSKGSPEGITLQAKREVRSLPVIERSGLRNIRKPSKVASHPQFHASSSGASASSECSTLLITAGTPRSPHKPGPSRSLKFQLEPPNQPVSEEKKASPTSCTIEEKVMMGIEENLQKCQEQEKVSASEAKQKTGPSLANWFGLRKTKLPALGGKKADALKTKEDKKEVKMASVLGVRHLRPDKRKEKRKSDCKESVEGQIVSPTNSKLSSILGQCNIQIDQIASQILSTAVYVENEPLVKELHGRSGPMGKGLEPSAVLGITTAMQQQHHHHSEVKVEKEICIDAAMSHMMNLEKGQEGIPDHGIGSTCQMRTLDSGIGTFPLPGTITGAAGRHHLPKSHSSPGGVVGRTGSSCTPTPAAPAPPPPPSPPPTAAQQPLGHAPSARPPSDPNHLPLSAPNSPSQAPTSDGSTTKRLSLKGSHEAFSAANEEEKEEEEEDERERGEEEELDAGRKDKRLLSNTEAEERKPVGETVTLSIMDCYRDDAFPRLEIEVRRFSHYGQSGDSLTSRGQHRTTAPSASSSIVIFPGDPAVVEPPCSLSDSLYGSFSSCASQGSNGL